MPVSRLYAEEVVNESLEKGITNADLLAFEFEMGLFQLLTQRQMN